LDETHDPAATSWVSGAEATDFPAQNLPLGIFSRAGEAPRGGIAIGDQILDLPAAALAGLFASDALIAAQAAGAATLNGLMGMGPAASAALRLETFRLLTDATHQHAVAPHLIAMADATMHLPTRVGNFSDFFASIFHATNGGKLFRPDRPLMDNYKFVPVAYHGRASSIRPSGTAVRRPAGQIKERGEPAPVYAASRNLDYELEVGIHIAAGSALGSRIAVEDAWDHVFGLCLLNDWSARDIQAWESQPLGPFLAKSFATTLSPWIVTAAALAPFRSRAFARPADDPAPLPHLLDAEDQRDGGLDITLEVFLLTEAMRARGDAPVRLSHGTFRDLYWTVAQLVTHQTSNGCNLEVGDLLGSGTVSGPTPDSLGSLLEITERATRKLTLPDGEQRGFLEDCDEVIFRGYCTRPGFARIGFGECRATVLPALPVAKSF
jgi:fumarylacetoacetase